MLGHGTDSVARLDARRSHCLAIAIACVCGLWLTAAPARAQLEIRIDTPSVALVPSAADYNQDYVEAVGGNGIQMKIRAQGLAGAHVFVRCSDPAPQIALNDLMIRTPTAAGFGGTAMSTFAPVTAVNQTLWSSTLSLPGFSTQLACEVRVRNLMFYDDSPSAGTTAYQNTLTFTIVSP